MLQDVPRPPHEGRAHPVRGGRGAGQGQLREPLVREGQREDYEPWPPMSALTIQVVKKANNSYQTNLKSQFAI